jgi:hypothetical protein
MFVVPGAGHIEHGNGDDLQFSGGRLVIEVDYQLWARRMPKLRRAAPSHDVRGSRVLLGESLGQLSDTRMLGRVLDGLNSCQRTAAPSGRAGNADPSTSPVYPHQVELD